MSRISFSFVTIVMSVSCVAVGETWMTPQSNISSTETIPKSWDVPKPRSAWIPIAGDITFFIPAFKKDDKTPGGIDSDGDGVRDDVQAAIDQRYANDEFTRKNSLLMAKVQQAILTGADSTLSTWEAVGYLDLLNQCIQEHSSDPLGGYKFIEPLQLNTYARSKKYIETVYHAHINNGPFPEPNLDCSL